MNRASAPGSHIPGVFLHDFSLCESTQIGPGTRIYAFTHILPGASIGRDCNLNDGVFVENDVIIGDRVTVKCGVQLWDGVRLADDVFVGPNATFTNDKYPRSKHYLSRYPLTQVGLGASIGANATILPGVSIGRGALVGAGAVVTRDVPPFSIVAGNPARITGYMPTQILADSMAASDPGGDGPIRKLQVDGARFVALTAASDLRGSLHRRRIRRRDSIPAQAHLHCLRCSLGPCPWGTRTPCVLATAHSSRRIRLRRTGQWQDP